ncbi:MAG: cytochrome c oxidase subunit 3 [Syntrophotaleaceae bacterium]
MNDVAHRDLVGARMGMWLFLFSELLLFGGLFILYAVNLSRYPEEFVQAAKDLDLVLGTANTLILITSSLTAAMALTALQLARRRLCLGLLTFTVVAAAVFLVNKGFEWRAKYSHGLFPGTEPFQELSHGKNIFYGLYYLTTGLHGLHVVVGGALLIWSWGLLWKNRMSRDNSIVLENCALYWHLVDLVWIFIFPLYYLLL